MSFQFSTQGIAAGWGGAGYELWPIGWQKVYAKSVELKAAQSNDKNGYLEYIIACYEGTAAGKETSLRFNLWNDNEVTVDIAKRQLAAMCVVCGFPQGFTNEAQLINRPFLIESRHREGTDAKKNARTYQDWAGIKYENGADIGGGGAIAQGAQGPGGQAPAQGQAPVQQQQVQQAPANNGGGFAPNSPQGGGNGGFAPNQPTQQVQQSQAPQNTNGPSTSFPPTSGQGGFTPPQGGQGSNGGGAPQGQGGFAPTNTGGQPVFQPGSQGGSPMPWQR